MAQHGTADFCWILSATLGFFQGGGVERQLKPKISEMILQVLFVLNDTRIFQAGPDYFG